MVSQGLKKRIRSLHRRKGREREGCFLVEGEKAVGELLQSCVEVIAVVAADHWIAPEGVDTEVFRTSETELAELSVLRNPSPVLAVAVIPPEPDVDLTRGRWFWLDGVRDPGNLGTIIRLADWFGLAGVVCSPDCVERTNPKVVQATMGSIFRVPVLYRPLQDLLGAHPGFWCAGTFMGGTPQHQAALPENGALILGNEGAGIRPELDQKLVKRVGIPGGGGAESLNVAMAAAVCAYEWTRH